MERLIEIEDNTKI